MYIARDYVGGELGVGLGFKGFIGMIPILYSCR